MGVGGRNKFLADIQVAAEGQPRYIQMKHGKCGAGFEEASELKMVRHCWEMVRDWPLVTNGCSRIMACEFKPLQFGVNTAILWKDLSKGVCTDDTEVFNCIK